MKNITIYKYIATSRPLDAHILISKFGDYKKPKDADELETQLKHFVRQNGEKGLTELAKIHPDRDLILELAKMSNSRLGNDFVSDPYTNFRGDEVLRPTPPSATTTITKAESENINLSKMMIFGSVVLISVALIMRPS